MKVSIIISNRNDLVMLNVTLRSAIEAMIPFGDQAEIVLVDNSDEEKWKKGIPAVIPQDYIRRKQIRIFRQEFPCFTEARMEAARQATGEYLFCVDSHVLFGYNTLVDAVNFMDNEAPDNIAFGHPPICWAGQGEVGKRWTLGISDRGTPWGNWARKGYREHGKMFWKFMPWICRRDWYLNTLNGYGSHAVYGLGWGGAEMLQQFKALMLGYENWALAIRPVIHIGPYGGLAQGLDTYKYRTYGANGKYPGIGVFVAFYVFLGEDGIEEAKKVEDRTNRRHGVTVEKHWDLARQFGKAEHEWLQANQKYSYHQLLEEYQ